MSLVISIRQLIISITLKSLQKVHKTWYNIKALPVGVQRIIRAQSNYLIRSGAEGGRWGGRVVVERNICSCFKKTIKLLFFFFYFFGMFRDCVAYIQYTLILVMCVCVLEFS